MGEEDIERQKLNVFRMNLLGAKVHPVSSFPQQIATKQLLVNQKMSQAKV